MTAADAARLAGEAYRTRIAHGEAAAPADNTRIAQEGYQSRLARDAAGGQPDSGEFFKLGDKIGGRYEVSAIHHGELGVVYGCFDHQTKLPRALKTVRARHASDKQVLSLFESEAAVWISLEKHPYIVRAYLVECFNSITYVITEYIRGPRGMEGDLRGWLGHPRLTLPVAVAMALQIAQGMQHAVRKLPNLVHRDLKPGNILVNGDGKAMVTDFGLVYAAQSDAGTPAYMSPEQWREGALDVRSDIYAYGCILFEMLTAHRLFPALTESDWERAHLESAPIALISIVRELPVEIDQFVRRCLAKDPAARPQNWDEVVAFFAEWYHRMTGKAVVLDFSSLVLDTAELVDASNSLWNLKRYKEAIQACDRALAIDQNCADAWSSRGDALVDLERYEEAIQAYYRGFAIDLDQKDAAAWSDVGSMLVLRERYEEAIKVFDRALAIDQNYADAWREKGDALHVLKRYEEAIQAFDRALAVKQNYDAAWTGKGDALRDLKRYEEALHAYDRALAISLAEGWNDPYPWTNKGEALCCLKRYEEAIEAYDQALAIDQKDFTVWYNKGDALYYLKRYEEANHSYVNAWINKGGVLDDLKRYEEAIEAYDRALAIDDNNAAAWSNKGNALYDLKRYEEAIQAYDRALAIDATNEFILQGRNLAANALKAAR